MILWHNVIDNLGPFAKGAACPGNKKKEGSKDAICGGGKDHGCVRLAGNHGPEAAAAQLTGHAARPKTQPTPSASAAQAADPLAEAVAAPHLGATPGALSRWLSLLGAIVPNQNPWCTLGGPGR